MIKSVVNQILGWTPYEIRRKRNERVLPDATFETIKLALAYHLLSKRLPAFVQIGACDGISGDPVHDFIVQGHVRALLVEPIQESLLKLQRTYEGVPNVTVVHAAIGCHDGDVVLFRVKEGATSLDSFWATQLASFNRAHLVRHGVKEHDIEEVKVPCLTLKTLLSKHGFETLDLLQIDTEGFDGEVVDLTPKIWT